SVNLKKVALLRNQRDLTYPSVTGMARIVIGAGADGVTVHPRPDERHIRKADVYDLAEMLATEYAGDVASRVEFNIEGNPTPDFLDLVEAVKPDQVTLVPDAPGQNTSDHGWDIPAHASELGEIISRLHGHSARVSLFVDDDPRMAEPAKSVGADRVELYTGPYHFAFMDGRVDEAVRSFVETAEAMRASGLGINAGHDLNLNNLAGFLSAIPDVEEVSIGHAITADALIMGMEATIHAYLAIIAAATVARPLRQAV
ncbi:MAG: pyridoxine 5'-phosphate synthase, partial [Rhodospirillales bacterium]|nr:pyridoxine 5'-phosphate synthase [Rhodospirillales bacterium]